MEKPLVKDVRAAETQIQGWGYPLSQANINRFLVAEAMGEPYQKVGRLPVRETRHLYDELALLTIPTPVRVEGTGPWTVRRCSCCSECLVICICDPAPCECEAETLCAVREFLTEDLHHVAPHGPVDPYRRAERLTGEKIDDWTYSDFRVVDAVIGRSIDSPFWPWTLPESQSPPGD